MPASRKHQSTVIGDPLWYKDAVIYELHVRAFKDGNGDGMGDFQGLTEQLDYLQDLGVTAIWLLPFCPSPLKDDGYDIADYTDVHPAYGNLQDFRTFLREAHRRGLRVITELVLNHTSDQHAWFQRARRAPAGSRWRNFYVWSDSPERYRQARVIFKDFESSNWTWDPVAKAYYWHRFYAHQPDLNYESADVRKAMFQAVDCWMELGVDGLRLDAVPYLYEREGTNCENLPETHAFLSSLRRHIDQRFTGRMLLAEANQWPEDAVTYFGKGDECHMAFHFPLMPRLFMASRLEERFPIIEILQQTPAIPESCQWAIFLRNHDELTLEMVTDEERDYMYRVYANDPQMRINLGIRRRLAPLLWNNRRKIELLNGLLLSMPGTPVIYYGDEIGMGDNVYLGDRNSVRTPMQWSGDRNAGFSRANPQKLFLPVIIDPEHHYEATNVETQQNNPSSMLWWMKRLIALRKRYKAFSRGTVEFLHPENRKVLVFLRRYQEETILVVANLSRFTQCAELDLSAWKGLVPVELFGQTHFPAIGDLPYFLTLGPHTFYWFALQPAEVEAPQAPAKPADVPVLEVSGRWDALVDGRAPGRLEFERLLPRYLKVQRWFGGKAKTIRACRISESIPISAAASVLLLHVEYAEAESETYLLPVRFADQAADGSSPLVRLRVRGRQGVTEGVLCEAATDREVTKLLVEAMARRRQFKGSVGELTASSTKAFSKELGAIYKDLEPTPLGAEQSNTSVNFEGRMILKFFRRLEQGVNPDTEIGRFLTEEQRFVNIPQMLGSLDYCRKSARETMTVAALQAFVPNEGDAWGFTREHLSEYFERVLAKRHDLPSAPAVTPSLVALSEETAPPLVAELIGAYAMAAQLLGGRTAELHVALAAGRNPAFLPEPFSAHYQRSLYQSMQGSASQALGLLRKRVKALPEPARTDGQSVLAVEGQILKRFQAIVGKKITAMRIRCHGDFHLGQVLYTGKDFVIIDFEGEPARSVSERRIKRSPLRDVAGMLRSFHYAAYSALLEPDTTTAIVLRALRPDDLASIEPWVRYWYQWVSAAFLSAYRSIAGDAVFLPRTTEELELLLNLYLLEKAVYELGYELNNRPDRVQIPLKGILGLIETDTSRAHVEPRPVVAPA